MLGIPLEIEVKFKVEISETKRDWLKKSGRCCEKAKRSGGKSCLFADCGELGRGVSVCYVHDRHCPIVHVNIFVAGFSCKTVSRQNSQRVAQGASTTLSEGGNTSTSLSYQGIMAYIRRYRPDFVFLENVDSLNDDPGGDSARNLVVLNCRPHPC